MTKIGLEICIDSLAGAEAAQAGGADRVELCASLSEGGLTASQGMMQAVARLDIPAFAMIRPRSGLFRFSPGEVDIMCADIINAPGDALRIGHGAVSGTQIRDEVSK